MHSTFTTSARLCALLFIFLFCSTAYAGPTKVEICHVPPDNPENFHTIKINVKALPSHLAHGDLGEPCNAVCATLCDDGDACTIDYEGDCEQNGCSVNPEPVDCNDNNLCTMDSCDPANGCINDAVVCDAEDSCAVSMCAPDTGECVDSEIVCDDGFECNPDTNECEEDAGEVYYCPCFTLAELQAGGAISECGENFPFNPNTTAVNYADGTNACSGENCVTAGTLSCAYNAVVSGISATENFDCGTLILQNCDNPN